MEKISKMSQIREIAEDYMGLCVKCGHLGAIHTPQDYHDQSRQGRTLSKIGKCRKCECTQFEAPKKKK